MGEKFPDESFEYGRPVTPSKSPSSRGYSCEALDWLQRAYDERVSTLFLIKVDPRFDALRQDPRYAEPMERMGLPAEPL